MSRLLNNQKLKEWNKLNLERNKNLKEESKMKEKRRRIKLLHTKKLFAELLQNHSQME